MRGTMPRAALNLSLIAAVALCACSSGAKKPDGGEAGAGQTSDGAKAGDGPHQAGDGSLAAPGEVGSACTSDQDCTNPAGARCFKTVGGGPAPTVTFPNGYCSKACGRDGDKCGKGGCASVGLSGSGGGSVKMTFCAAGCSKDTDCREAEGYKCMIIFFGLGICVP